MNHHRTGVAVVVELYSIPPQLHSESSRNGTGFSLPPPPPMQCTKGFLVYNNFPGPPSMSDARRRFNPVPTTDDTPKDNAVPNDVIPGIYCNVHISR